MELVKGFAATSQDDYQLNIINIFRHGARNSARQEIASQTPAGMLRQSYAQSFERVNRLANALKSLGVQPGDRVGVMDWNSYRHFECYFALPGMGAVLLLLNLRLATPDLAYVINHAKAKVIIVDQTLAPFIEAAAPLLETVEGYVIIGDGEFSAVRTKLAPAHGYEELLAAAAPEYDWPHLDERSAAAACYTTGTTGRPKGVFYSHRCVYLHTMAVAMNSQASDQDCFLQLVPMFHALGWGGVYYAVMVGAKIVFPGMYNLERLDLLAKLMIDEGVTMGAGAPALLMPMLEYIRGLEQKPDLGRTRFFCGASEPPLAMMKGFHDLCGLDIMHAYGATETTPLASANRLKPWLADALSDDEKWDLRRKQGLVINGLDVKLLGMNGEPLPFDGKSAGEICLRGPWITGRYHDAPGSEAQFTPDGYWRSGDVGTIDQEGYLKVTDRLKDVIKTGGEWISSVDMENAIMSFAPALEAAVVGVKHPKWEERPLALVILRPEFKGQVSADDVRAHLSKSFAKWQLPDQVLFVDQIPKTSVGKISKKDLRQAYQDIYMK
ncbi:AMP-dependent synthetase and ligase [Desulfarculus baarsii DSM 2075]|uniref:AMP-dependent synthetase and ligase n=1 Tax=Desulfarculus baarsii (strain ATCC 33931 / DSM 2075 / LMG 7858 / VKM B-1802 / 2st14) TaxID=644282 RepID=E1QGG4_DESB2|nr:long-chain-fatty-acid--CoA ligase [Desulfarculus baarsii]ADK84657.1 AMP-dependent synthetase and ligase [Desulfarculus baarsii DSM 2075]